MKKMECKWQSERDVILGYHSNIIDLSPNTEAAPASTYKIHFTALPFIIRSSFGVIPTITLYFITILLPDPMAFLVDLRRLKP